MNESDEMNGMTAEDAGIFYADRIEEKDLELYYPLGRPEELDRLTTFFQATPKELYEKSYKMYG